MNIDIQQLIIAIISGLIGSIIGALVGGYLTYKGAIDAAKKQTDFLYKQEREQRDFDKEKQKNEIINSLLSETRLNYSLSFNYQKFFNPNTYLSGINREIDLKSSPLLIVESWSVHKGNINLLASSLQETLLDLYSNISRYNTTLSFIKNIEFNPDYPMYSQYMQGTTLETMRDYLHTALEKISKYQL